MTSTLAMAQSVVPDGGTATSVTLGASGQITVGVAPASSASISHNTYTNFSVPNSGVNFDNSIVSAGTIINEVTSASRSTIEGPVRVIGSKADIIIANPNGITVNGGRFVNTGNVALSTGTIGQDAASLATSTVTGGDIVIGSDGLSGTMEELALISKALKINGAVAQDVPTDASHINIITGEGSVNFDRVRGGVGVDGAGLLPWAFSTDRGSSSSDAVVVDITSRGSLSSGRISVTVNDAGAGVRFAGDQMASTGGFRLSSTGQLEVINSVIDSKSSVNIRAKSADLISPSGSRTSITSQDSGVFIETTDGDINLGTSEITGAIVSSDNLGSSGGVTLFSSGDITARQKNGLRASLTSDARDLPNTLSNSNVAIAAGGNVHIDGLDIITTDDFQITSNGAVELKDVNAEIGADFRILSDQSLTFDSSTINAQSDIRLDGSDLRFGMDDASQSRTELNALNGGLVARAVSGDILNFGSLLQGRVVSAGDADSLGGVSLYADGALRNKSLSVDRLGVVFGQVDDLYIETTGDVLNETGRLFSNAGITITSDGDIINETGFTTEVSPFEIQRISGGRFAGSLFLKRKRTTSVTADYGEQVITGEQSFILGVGDVSLSAKNIHNIGADITGASVGIDASKEFLNQSRQVGKLSFYQKCKWFCKTSGSSTLRSFGGIVTASAGLEVTAGAKVTNLGGRIDGTGDIIITAPLTEFIPQFSATLVERPSGLTGFFRGQRGFISTTYDYGGLRSFTGSITIDGDASLGDANIFALGEPVISGTRIETQSPVPPVIFERENLGFFGGLF